MASGPDLFVVCKSCGSEVSPYITECPYCGTRLRKRAPKLDRAGGTPKEPRRARPRLAPLRRGEIPGIRPDRRPYATIALVLVSVVVTLLGRAGWDRIGDLVLFGPLEGDWWRPVTTLFVYGGTGYEVAALAAVAVFGILLERRHGWWAPLAAFLVGGALGMLLVAGVDELSVATGANGAALALVAAWAMRDVLG
ncbi:MAG: zinc ribbon domain-containing protein, partial [Solirubrobacterales bacterium]|nr:zinc ribbon domain-containing protein [Solirubrobacterales bacterium]